MDRLVNIAILVTVYLIGFLQIPLQVENPPSQQPSVQAILFYSSGCPDCHQVINGFLAPFQHIYGDQLQVIGIDTSHPVGSEIYGKTIAWYEIPQFQQGVPTLVVGDVVLVGSNAIPALFPGVVEAGLASGGIGWPDVPELAAVIPDLPPSAGPISEPETVAPAAAEPIPSTQDGDLVPVSAKVASGEETSEAGTEKTVGATGLLPKTSKPAGGLENVNTEAMPAESEIPPLDSVESAIAALVLLGMLLSLVYTVWLIIKRMRLSTAFPLNADHLTWAVPLLALLGLGVAFYLSYVEVAHVKAFYGHAGEYNIVQAGEYAQLVGIPIAVLGALSYVSVVVLWIGQRFMPARQSAISFAWLVTLTILGTVFSIYLTVIELFAIRAVCAWCLTSAVISTLLMILVATSMIRQPSNMRLVVHT